MLQGGPGVVYSQRPVGRDGELHFAAGHGGSARRYRPDCRHRPRLPRRRLLRRPADAGLVLQPRRLLPLFRRHPRLRNFPADNGGQLTGTLAHKWDSGKILFYARVLNDKNLFITDIPVTVSGTGNSQSVSAFPGFNPNTGTFAGDGLRGISVQEAPGQAPITADLADGRGANLHTFGNDLDLQLTDTIAFSNKTACTRAAT